MARKPTPPKKPEREWRITLVRKKGHVLGRITAPDAESAIAKAADLFGVPEAQRRRLIAQPME